MGGVPSLVKRRIHGKEFAYLEHSVRYSGAPRKISVYLGPWPRRPGDKEKMRQEGYPRFLRQVIQAFGEFMGPRWRAEHMAPAELVSMEAFRASYQLGLRLLYPDELEEHERGSFEEYTHTSTSIEGNSLSLAQVSRLLERGEAPGGKSLREIHEVANFAKVRDYTRGYRGALSTRFVRKVHALTMENILRESIGEWRRVEVGIRGADFRPSPPVVVDEEMEALCGWVESQWGVRHPIELSAVFHLRFEEIHPFIDGNGRVGRETANLILTRWGFPRLICPKEWRDDYIDVLDAGHPGDPRPIVGFFSKCLVRGGTMANQRGLAALFGGDEAELAKRASTDKRLPKLLEPRSGGRLRPPP